MAKKKAEVKAQTPVRDPMDLSALEGIVTAPTEAPKASKKVARPTLVLAGEQAKRFNVLQAAKSIKLFVETTIKAGDGEVKDEGLDFYVEKGLALGCSPVNPQIQTEMASTTFTVVGGQKFKVLVAPGKTLVQTLTEAGVPAEVAAEIATEVTVKPRTTIKPLQELRDREETKPLFQKVYDFLASLPVEERKELIDNNPETLVAETFFDKTFSVVSKMKGSEDDKKEAVKKVFGVIKPQYTATSNKFNGSPDDALETIKKSLHESSGSGTVKTETVKTTKTVVSA